MSIRPREPLRRLHAAGLAVAGLALCPQAGAVEAAASIRPVHSLLAAVMEGAGEPALLLRGGESPHTYALRPSDARRIAEADLVVWVGETMESALAAPVRARKGAVLTLTEQPELQVLEFRPDFVFDADVEDAHDDHGHETRDSHGHDSHGGHGHDGHDEHGHEAHGGHGHDGHDDHGHDAHDGHGHHGHGGHSHAAGLRDPHLWLDPVRARATAALMAEALAELDPARAQAYRANAAAVGAKLDALHADLERVFAPAAGRGFLMLHDAWQYMDTRYGLRALGALRTSIERAPSAHRLVRLARLVRAADARCVLAEPQVSQKLAGAFAEDLGLELAVLDPIGIDIAPGAALYFDLMRRNADRLAHCLSAS